MRRSRPSSRKARRGWAAISNRPSDGLFTTTPAFAAGTPSRTSRSRIAGLTVMTAVEAATDSRSWSISSRCDDRVRSARKPAAEELRHRLVQVEQHRDADEPKRQRREHEEVRQGVDLDEREPLAPMQPDRGEHRPHQERHVLAQVHAEPRALVALHVEVLDANARDLGNGGSIRLPKPEHHDRTPGSDQRLRLAPDARVLLVVAVDDHEDRPRRAGSGRAGAGRHARVDQPAPRRSTWRSRVERPAELSTVSTTSVARS